MITCPNLNERDTGRGEFGRAAAKAPTGETVEFDLGHGFERSPGPGGLDRGNTANPGDGPVNRHATVPRAWAVVVVVVVLVATAGLAMPTAARAGNLLEDALSGLISQRNQVQGEI